jgi:hypothetical protein
VPKLIVEFLYLGVCSAFCTEVGKSLFMAERYTKEALKFYGQNGDDILISNAIEHIVQFSMIHGDTE